MREADDAFERRRWKEASERQLADRDDHLRTDDGKLALQPSSACILFFARRNTVAASARIRAGIASRHGRDVDAAPSRRLIDTGSSEPAEQSLARSAGEGHSAGRLDFARSLSDDHDLGRYRKRLNRRHISM